MLRIVKEEVDNGTYSAEVRIYSSKDDLLRRILKDSSGGVVLDYIYEYDFCGRCLSGLLLDGEQKVICTYENTYSETGFLLQSLELDISGAEINRVKYSLDGEGRLALVEIFNRGKKVGHAVPIDKDDENSTLRYFDASGREVPYIEVERGVH